MHPTRRGISTLKVFLLIVGILLLGLCVWSGLLVRWAITATPSVTVDYGQKIHELAIAGQDTSARNDYDVLQRLGATIRQIDSEFEQKYGKQADAPQDWSSTFTYPVDLSALESADAPAKAKEIAHEYVDRVKASTLPADLKTVREARLIARPAPKGALIDILLPELGDCRRAARFSRARAVLAAEAGDWDQFVEAIADTRGLSRACNRDPVLISHLVSVAIDSMAADVMREMIIAHDIPEPTLEKLAAVFADDPSRRPLADTFEAERLFFLDMSQRTHDKSGRFIPSSAAGLSSGGIGGGTASPPAITNVLSIAMPSKEQTESLAERVYARMKELAAMPRSQRRGDADSYLGIEIPQRYILISLMAPAIGKAISATDQCVQQLRATQIMIALERYRSAKGAYPERTAELVPTFLPAIPEEPYSSKGFIYKRGAAARAGYTLYSVGDDDEDNNAARAPSEFDALKAEGKGTDFVFVPKKP